MRRPWDRVRHAGAAAGWAGLLIPLAIVLLSVGLAPDSPLTTRAALATFCALALWRPADALLVPTALVGFGIILAHLGGVGMVRVTEALVIAALAGCCARAIPRDAPLRRALTASMSVPVVLLAIAAIASTVVWLRVSQIQTGYDPAYLESLLHFLRHQYFLQIGEFPPLVSASVLLEGLALYVVAGALCRSDAAFFDRAIRMLALGGAGLALMSVVRLAEIWVRDPGAIAALRASYAGLRISPQIPDYIAAGSYFALCWLAALGLAIASHRRRLAWVACGLPIAAGLYLTGSRSVIAAALGGLAVLVLAVVRKRAVPDRGVIVFAGAAVVVMIVGFPWMIGHDVLGKTARESLTVRLELLETGTRVLATRPLFGVGIDRFWVEAEGLTSPALNALWQGRKNPHNDFLRVAAELGLVGLGLFAWILAAAARRIRDALRRTGDARLAGLTGGLAAFLITSLFSNPLMLRDVSFAFWIALGLAVGRSAELAPAAAIDGGSSALARWTTGVSRWRWAAAALIAGALLVSIPYRARQELANIDLTHVSYGLSEWGAEPDGTPFRWSGSRVTFFVNPTARLMTVPLRGSLPSGVVQQVEVRVDGRPANGVAIGTDWQVLRTPLPTNASAAARRIDLQISPTWVPADVLPGNDDRRVLGVKVGAIKVQ